MQLTSRGRNVPGAMIAMVDREDKYCVVASSQTKKENSSGSIYKRGEIRTIEILKQLNINPEGGVSVAWDMRLESLMPACGAYMKALEKEMMTDGAPHVDRLPTPPVVPETRPGPSSSHGGPSRPASPPRSNRIHKSR